MNNISRMIIVTVLIAALAGCASDGVGMAGSGSDCDAAKTAGAGALIGALLGAAIGGQHGAEKGALAGAALGGLGCLASNYESKKIRDAQAVNHEYIQYHHALPPEPTVTSYSLQSPRQATRGNNVVVNSTVTLVDGQNEPVNRVEEKLYIISADGKRREIKSKAAQASGSEGGEYTNTFGFTPPSGLSEGNYRLESEVYVNNKFAQKAKAPLMITYNSSGLMQIALID